MTDLIKELSLELQRLERELANDEARLSQLRRILGPARSAFRECKEDVLRRLYHVQRLHGEDGMTTNVIAAWRAPRQDELDEMDSWGRYNYKNHRDELEEERAMKLAVSQLRRQIDSVDARLKAAQKKRSGRPRNDAQMALF